jgi:hypothetical protein
MNAKEETVMDNKLGSKYRDNNQSWKRGPCPSDKKEDRACKNNDNLCGCCCRCDEDE